MNERKETQEKVNFWFKIGAIAACVAVVISISSLIVAGKSCSVSEKAKNQSATFSAINAEIAWNQVRDEYEEIDNELSEWEKEKGVKREGVVPASLNDLDIALGRLKLEVPEKIKRLYRKRYRKYESLKSMAKQYEPFADRFVRVDFTVPAPPKLPSVTMRGVSGSGITIR